MNYIELKMTIERMLRIRYPLNSETKQDAFAVRKRLLKNYELQSFLVVHNILR